MLKSLIYKIEGLIAQLTSDEVNTPDNTKVYRERWANTFGAECELIRQKLLHELFGARHEPAVFRYVHFHQAHFIRLSNLVSISLSGSNPEKAKLFNVVLAELEKLVAFLRESFPQYFDLDQRLSSYSSVNDAYGIHSLWARLRELSESSHERPLLQIILNWFTGIQSDLLYHNCTYQQAEQAHLVFKMVNEMIFLRGMAEDQLALSLFRENFNLTAFVSWYQDSLSQKIAEHTPGNRQNEFIDRQILLLESITHSPEKVFEPDLPPLAQQIIPWLKSKHTGNNRSRHKYGIRTNGNGHMPLNFSVAQFALFVRLLYLEGCFQVNNITRIHRFFTQHFNTKKQADISVKSFARAFYNSDQSAAAVIRDYLQRMTAYIDKTYFPKS